MECLNDSRSDSGYLVLTRRPGQSIRIGSRVEILIVGIMESVVRLEIAERTDADGLPPSASFISCRLNQCIQLGRDISLRVARVCPRGVRLGITAPTAVTILRSELCR